MHKPRKRLIAKRIRNASERGRRMAKARWDKDRERRAALAVQSALDPLRIPGRILQRVVVITDGTTAVEIIRRDSTSQREWARLKRSVGL